MVVYTCDYAAQSALNVTHTYAEDMCMANDYAAQNALDVEPMQPCIPIYKHANNTNVTFHRQNKQT